MTIRDGPKNSQNMKTNFIGGVILAAVLALPSWVYAGNSAAIEEILKLKQAGIEEQTIVAYIQNHNQSYNLTADDVLTLKEKGLSSTVLSAMLSSGPPQVAPSPAPAPAPVQSAPSAMTPQPQPAPMPAAPQPAVTVVPMTTTAPAPVVVASQPAVSYFYQELSPYGRWIVAEDGQWCWQPTIVVATPNWRPYWDNGHWLSTDLGWCWYSDYPWGWAAFHYGRWSLHPHHGWIWYPDNEWAPAWVVWRSSADYCGWAPLPPHAAFDHVRGGFVYHGDHVAVGFDFGLGASCFSFTYVADLGEKHHRHPPQHEITRVYNQTTVINNYVKVDNHIVNKGIEPQRVSTARGRPIETVHIKDLNQPAPGTRRTELLDSKTQTLEIYRPRLETPATAKTSTSRSPTGRTTESPNALTPQRQNSPTAPVIQAKPVTPAQVPKINPATPPPPPAPATKFNPPARSSATPHAGKYVTPPIPTTSPLAKPSTPVPTTRTPTVNQPVQSHAVPPPTPAPTSTTNTRSTQESLDKKHKETSTTDPK
jgi:hypothetical protein